MTPIHTSMISTLCPISKKSDSATRSTQAPKMSRWKTLALLLLLPALAPLHAAPVFIDLSQQANASWEDDGIADNGAGGWTDEGINDFYIYPPLETGEVTRNNHTFRLLDAKKNNDRSVVLLKGSERSQDKPSEVEIPANGAKGKFVYFLQNAAGRPRTQEKNALVAEYEVVYGDGTSVKIPVRDDLEIRQWYTPTWYDNSGRGSWPFLTGVNSYSRKWKKGVGLWAFQWENPSPDKPISKIILRSMGGATPAIFAITVDSHDAHADQVALKTHYVRPPEPPAEYFLVKEEAEKAGILAAAAKENHFQGLCAVDVIRPDLLAVTVDGGFAGNALSASVKEPSPQPIKIQANGKPVTIAGKPGRQSVEYWNGNLGPYPVVTLFRHTYFVSLEKPLAPGATVDVAVDGIAEPLRRNMEFTYDPASTITPAIKINQVAYSPLSPTRFAYLGWWAGDRGPVDFSAFKTFEVVDEKTGRVALEGALVARAANDPASGEQIHEMDLGKLPVGQYHLRIPGLARSDSFGVGGKGITKMYQDTLRAFFHQRAGVELPAANTDFPRPATHTQAYESGYMVGNPNYVPKPGEAVKTFSGGYHDAGDDDVFTQHLRATAQPLYIYEARPAAFKDGDLNIPESGNRIPDILDEAEFALSFYKDTQREDGAIYYGRGNDEDYIREIEKKTGKRPAFGLLDPRNNSASEYAAVAALVSRLFQPIDPAKSKSYLDSAKKAYAWAVKNPDEKPDIRLGNDILLAWAAAELFKTTSEESYHQDFLRLIKENEALKKAHWSAGFKTWIPRWTYLTTAHPAKDAALDKEFRDALLKDAAAARQRTFENPYRNGWNRKAAGWGNHNGGGHHSFTAMMAYLLTNDPTHLETVSLNADFQLGANPLSKTFISGIGSRPPNFPQIHPKLYTGPKKTGRTVPGITIYGISCGKADFNDMTGWYPVATPGYRCWRDLGNGGAEISSEFTINETLGHSAMLYAFLHAMAPNQ